MGPTSEQLALLALAAALYAAGGVMALARVWQRRGAGEDDGRDGGASAPAAPGRGPMLLIAAGIAASVGVIVWHAVTRPGWQPMTDNFEALLWLATLLAGFVLYVQWHKPIRGLDTFLMPVVVLLLIGAGVFGRSEFHPYRRIGADTWIWVHHVAAYGGAVAYAIAAALGAMYVVSVRRLRAKRPAQGPPLGSLEALERLMMLAVTLGFALLTVGLVTGVGRMIAERGLGSTSSWKVALATLAWLVYAVVMHAPIHPRLRGRRAAILSVAGFLLVVGSLVVVQVLPGGGGGQG